MQTYTFSQCITLLDIDAKVFRRWVRGDLGLGERDQVSRADSRVRYLTREQLEQLAQLHDKTLPADDQGEGEDEHISPGVYKLLVDRMEMLERLIQAIQETVSSSTEAAAYYQLQVSHLRDTFEHPETGISARLDTVDRRITELEDSTQPPPVPHAEQQIAELEATYQRRISELEAQLAAYQQKKQPTPPPAKKKPARKKKRSIIKALPTTLVARNAFSTLHNISEKVVSKASLDGKIATTEGKWLSGGYVVTRAFNEKGKHDFYQVFYQRQDFKACEQCPHTLEG